MSGRVPRNGVREPQRGRDRGVRVPARPDVGDGHRVGRGEHLGERVEQGRGAVEGQRFVDGPHAAARLALADGDQRLADRGGVMAVVVVHDDAPRLALALETPADASEPREPGDDRAGVQPDGRGRARHPQGVGGVVTARRGQAHDDRSGEGVETVDLEHRGVPLGRDDPAEQRLRRSGRRAEPPADPLRVPAHALGRGIHERGGDDPAGPVTETVGQRRDAVVGDVGDEHGRRPRSAGSGCAGGPPDPRLERGDHRLPVREHVGMVPLRRGDDGDRRPVRVEVARVLVRLDDERRPGRARSTARGRGHADAGQRRGQQRADEGARIHPAGRQDPDEPAGRGALAVRPRDGDQRPPGRGIRHHLLPGLERDARPRARPRAPRCPGRSP